METIMLHFEPECTIVLLYLYGIARVETRSLPSISIFYSFLSLSWQGQWPFTSIISKRKMNISVPFSQASVPSAKRNLSCSATSAVVVAGPN